MKPYAPKVQKRTRVVAAEECPRCGAVIGQTCRSYKGRGTAPHVLSWQVEEEPAGEEAEGGRPLTQGWLFDPPAG